MAACKSSHSLGSTAARSRARQWKRPGRALLREGPDRLYLVEQAEDQYEADESELYFDPLYAVGASLSCGPLQGDKLARSSNIQLRGIK